MTTKLAVYDLDRTITRAGTYTPFLIHWAQSQAPWRLAFAPAAVAVMGAYAAKRISRKRLKEIMQTLLMGGATDERRLAPMVDAFADRMVSEGIYPEAKAVIAADRAEGRRIILATAAHEFYAAAIAARLGFDDVVATRSARDEAGALLASIEGENCYGPAKLAMLKAYMDDAGIDRTAAHVRFYSDHVSDLPVFEWADEPVAVNPSPKLKKVAAERAWPITDWSNA
jgi:HAD superfamily hydrolase (TIGR01490 family)